MNYNDMFDEEMMMAEKDIIMNGRIDSVHFEKNFVDRLKTYKNRKPQVIRNMNVVLDTFTHYSRPDANKERTIFGEAEEGLFYNYSDRLSEFDYDKHKKAHEEAAKQATPKTARYFQIMLSYFHDGAEVNLKHIMAGCNRSNGFDYLIFGYTYKEVPKVEPPKVEEV